MPTLMKGQMTRIVIPLPEEKPISLNPLNLGQALTRLLKIPDPDATKPKPKREKRTRKQSDYG